ncbi:hypothetical protein BRYFOR_07579 [Marvinbryantia formatexigens DSM 14469]|uniref:Uncharacterized protein n=1 Tax=Marvinbryantia formatexigens DSM 14469 TaxID=478749 RepID=C6LG19_9FIRM|nr:hypothetical protein [Marvinbryantia formatexigens]EET60383.1 hypothetical protein BRYFOR_07579 [Marvinbryantia formatexigens DSM 14469]UWO25277.1 hypothetical protein NQ534_01935 [Marvinbryantia formatexigens DSM 14469]SDH03235.1 hypothetical protein SAMN05660368_03711 [Marvinbryantia formatexigens]
MKYIQFLRTYAAVATGLLLGAGTASILWINTDMDICSLLFAGMLVFSITASGFMVLTEAYPGRVRIREHKKPERKLQIYTLEGKPQWIPSETCDGMEELRIVVSR